MKSSIKDSSGDKIFDYAKLLFVTSFFLAVLYPIMYVLSASLSSPEAVSTGRVFLWPVEPTLRGYITVFRQSKIWIGYGNSLYYTLFGTLINVIMTMAAAYPLSRKDFLGRNIIMFIFTFTMFFNGGLIPTYLLVSSLGMVNTRWAMLIPGAMGVWNVIITRTYLKSTIPDELLEASKLDGCTDMQFLLKIVIRLSGPILAVISLFYAVGHWNSFFSALIYLRTPRLYPLQIILRDILIVEEMRDITFDLESYAKLEAMKQLMKYSLIVVASLPVLIMYPFAQRFFIKGIMIGAIKG